MAKIVLLLLDLAKIEYNDHSGNTVDRKILAEEKLVNLANCELFTKFSLPILADTLKIYLAYALTTVGVFDKVFLTNSFYLYSLPKFSPAKFSLLCLQVRMKSHKALVVKIALHSVL